MASEWQLTVACSSPYARELSLTRPGGARSLRVLATEEGTAELLATDPGAAADERGWRGLLDTLAAAGVRRLLLSEATDDDSAPRASGASSRPETALPDTGAAPAQTRLPGTPVGGYLCFEGGLPRTAGWPGHLSCCDMEELEAERFDPVFLETARESRDPYYAHFASFCLAATRHWHYSRPSCVRVMGFEQDGELIGTSSYWLGAGGRALMLHGGVVRRRRGRRLSLAIAARLVERLHADGVTRTHSRIARDSPIMLGHMARIGHARVGTAELRVVGVGGSQGEAPPDASALPRR